MVDNRSIEFTATGQPSIVGHEGAFVVNINNKDWADLQISLEDPTLSIGYCVASVDLETGTNPVILLQLFGNSSTGPLEDLRDFSHPAFVRLRTILREKIHDGAFIVINEKGEQVSIDSQHLYISGRIFRTFVQICDTEEKMIECLRRQGFCF